MAVERVIVDDRTAFLRRPDHRAVRVLALAGLVVFWELITRTGLVSSLFLPSPTSSFASANLSANLRFQSVASSSRVFSIATRRSFAPNGI